MKRVFQYCGIPVISCVTLLWLLHAVPSAAVVKDLPGTHGCDDKEVISAHKLQT